MNGNSKLVSIQVILTVLLFIATGVSGYVATRVLSNQDRIIALEVNRFTVADGQLIWREFGEIRREIGDVREALAKRALDVPPAWFIKRIDRIEDRLHRMERYLKGETS